MPAEGGNGGLLAARPAGSEPELVSAVADDAGGASMILTPPPPQGQLLLQQQGDEEVKDMEVRVPNCWRRTGVNNRSSRGRIV